MRLIREADGAFTFLCHYEERSIAKSAGFIWRPTRRVWASEDIHCARNLANYAEEPLRSEITDGSLDPLAASMALAPPPEFFVPAPPGKQYFPYQLGGIHYMLARPATLCADVPGLGKTIQSIGVYNADASISTVLIICPAIIKEVWQRLWSEWAVDETAPQVISGSNDTFNSNIIVINYEILGAYRKSLRQITWDLLIVDEAHRLKNAKAQRTREVLGARGYPRICARRQIFLTGTPILNRPIELWPILRTIDPARLGRDWSAYTGRYCAAQATKYGWNVSGNSNLPELQLRLRSTIMVRREKADVLTDLPPKVTTVVPVSSRHVQNLIEREKELYKSVRRTVAQFQEVSVIRRRLGEAKTPAIVDYIKMLLESADKVVFFAHHRQVVHEVAGNFPSVVLDSGTPQSARAELIRQFQTDTNTRVFAATTGSGGEGITLTAADQVVIGELDWTPQTISQAEDRLHRIGQERTVFVHYIVFTGSVDEMIAAKMAEKMDISASALDQAAISGASAGKQTAY